MGMARTIKPVKEKTGGKIASKSTKGIAKEQQVARKKALSIKTPAVKQHSQPRKPRKRSHISSEIKFYSSRTGNLVPKAVFIRLIKSFKLPEVKFTRQSIEALQDAYESYIVSTVETSYLATHHAKRVTLMATDLNVVRKIKERGMF